MWRADKPSNRRVDFQSGLRAFNRIDVLFTIAVAIIVIVVVVVGGGQVRERVRRAHCRGNLAQTYAALRSYASDNKDLLPNCTRKNPKFSGTVWPLDLNANLADDLGKRGAGRKVLYCPSNAGMDIDALWNFGAGSSNSLRLVGYAFLLNGNVPASPGIWRTNILGDGVAPPAQTELVTDLVMSEAGNYSRIEASHPRRTSHLAAFSSLPAGGNVAFEDGHVIWRDFKVMQHRYIMRGVNPVTKLPRVVDWDF
jgi:hypothetical protein